MTLKEAVILTDTKAQSTQDRSLVVNFVRAKNGMKK